MREGFVFFLCPASSLRGRGTSRPKQSNNSLDVCKHDLDCFLVMRENLTIYIVPSVTCCEVRYNRHAVIMNDNER